MTIWDCRGKGLVCGPEFRQKTGGIGASHPSRFIHLRSTVSARHPSSLIISMKFIAVLTVPLACVLLQVATATPILQAEKRVLAPDTYGSIERREPPIAYLKNHNDEAKGKLLSSDSDR
ncbi:hypothetical protein DAEQUDRAFT_202636 [Daedalea quercina L-15889]|uniref:Uncharacterized protein n=1 Tax=Daedalea quercina L-15889 TaxID=1314783 RepID=A0A165R725_9APHY|nr:hypothetical protein DAEQUDRAFT_202636 [Daedalea quercina L-15889]